MSRFWKGRLATFFWGWGVSWAFTGHFFQASLMFLIIVLGNTALMWWFWGKKTCTCND